MIPVSPLSGLAQIYYFLLYTRSALAVFQNITVDDAVLTGAVVPQYLPSSTAWNQGNDCSKCLVKPDPSQAYNGTWHDTTFNPSSGIHQAIEFIFVGSAIYIFFILANDVPDATTLTDIVFYLDGIAVNSYAHSPSASTDYQYNVPVYTNESLTFSQHNMTIEPLESGNSVLILFDYLVYTTDTDNPSTSSSIPSSATRKNTAAIVGGTVGGVTALLAIASLVLCYWRHKKRQRSRILSSNKDVVLGSLLSLNTTAVPPVPFEGTRFYHTEHHPSKPQPILARSSETWRSTSPPISINPPSTAPVPCNDAAILEQVELLREEISHLRRLHRQRTKASCGYS